MYEEYLEFSMNIAREAGNILKRYFRDEIEEMEKGVGDLVTEADRASEEYLIRAIKDNYPNHAILAEESGYSEGSEYTWVIDPLDGTTNFRHHIPYFNVSIALEHKQEVVVGVVYNPILDEMFYATKDSEARLNGKKIAPAQDLDLKNMFIGICRGNDRPSKEEFIRLTEQYVFKAREIRRLGSAALEICYVASGRLAAFIGLNLKPWDYRAAMLIAERAGCYLIDHDDKIEVYGSKKIAEKIKSQSS
ncbi:MAG: inositol monophosphatase family protein [Candidatus Anstonellales archaeon]